MEEDKKTWGGKRMNSGAPKKAEVVQTNLILLEAIKETKNIDNDFEARKAFAKELLTFERGKMFIAEHLFGKPVQTIDNNVSVSNFDITKIYDTEAPEALE